MLSISFLVFSSRLRERLEDVRAEAGLGGLFSGIGGGVGGGRAEGSALGGLEGGREEDWRNESGIQGLGEIVEVGRGMVERGIVVESDASGAKELESGLDVPVNFLSTVLLGTRGAFCLFFLGKACLFFLQAGKRHRYWWRQTCADEPGEDSECCQ